MAEHTNPKLRPIIMRYKKIIDPRMTQNEMGGFIVPKNNQGEDEFVLEEPIKEGNLFIAQETGEMFFDLEDCRVQISPVWKTLE